MSFNTCAPASPTPMSSTRVPMLSTERRRNAKSRLWNLIAPNAMTAVALPNTITDSGIGPAPASGDRRRARTPATKLIAPDRSTRRASCTLA